MLRRCLRVVESEAYNIQLGLVCVERFERIGAVKTPQRLIRRNGLIRLICARIRAQPSTCALGQRPLAAERSKASSSSRRLRERVQVCASPLESGPLKSAAVSIRPRAIIRRPAQQTNAKPMPSTTLCDFSSKRIRNESAFVLCRGTSSEFGVRARTICIQQPGEHIAPEVGANG